MFNKKPVMKRIHPDLDTKIKKVSIGMGITETAASQVVAQMAANKNVFMMPEKKKAKKKKKFEGFDLFNF